MSITPARPATIISICSVNSRFPLDFEQIIGYTKSVIPHAGVVELADARDSKSRVRKDVRVRPPPPAPKNQHLRQEVLVFAYLKCSRRAGTSCACPPVWILKYRLRLGENGEAYRLTHDGKAVTFTLGEKMTDVSAILTKP